MADLDLLRQLVDDDVLVLPESDARGRNVIELAEEPADGGPPYSVTIRNVPEEVVAVRADRFPEPAFKNSRGERKRADFIVIANTERRNWIVYIEMKTGKPGSLKVVTQQLMGASCLVEYWRAVVRVFWKERDFLAGKRYAERFVGVTGVSLNKRPTRWRRGPVHDAPENMLKINAPGRNGLRFTELVGGD